LAKLTAFSPQIFPALPLREAVARVYPEVALYAITQLESKQMLHGIFDALVFNAGMPAYRVVAAHRDGGRVALEFAIEGQVAVTTVCEGGPGEIALPDAASTLQDHHWQLLSGMLQSHCAGVDLCIIGEKGCGKSFMARQFALALGYAPVETLFIYADMTSRDLLQRRTTGDDKETLWQPTPLAIAVRTGRLAILDGIHRLPLGTISTLLRLIEDREITLFDGSRYVQMERYREMQRKFGLSEDDLTARNIFPVHPSFRILCLATPPTMEAPWLTNEMMNLYHFFTLDVDLTSEQGREHSASLLQSIVSGFQPEISATLSAYASAVGADAISLRTMLRIARRTAQYPSDLSEAVSMNMMTMFMPAAARLGNDAVMCEIGLDPEAASATGAAEIVAPEGAGQLLIGDISYDVTLPENPQLVPEIVFFEIPSHTLVRQSRAPLQWAHWRWGVPPNDSPRAAIRCCARCSRTTPLESTCCSWATRVLARTS
jgi:hypothetical protein